MINTYFIRVKRLFTS